MSHTMRMFRYATPLCGFAAGTFLASCAYDGSRQARENVHSAVQAAAPAPAPSPRTALRLLGPSLNGWKPTFPADPPIPAGSHFTHVAIVTDLSVPLYRKADGRTVVGYSGVGRLLPARPTGIPCKDGTWHEVSGKAYLCDGAGVRIEKRPFRRSMLDDHAKAFAPDLNRPVPYRHGKARVRAPLLTRIPTEDELAALDRARKPDGLVDRTLDGTYLLTLVQRVAGGSERFYRLLTGEYIREKDVKPFPDPQMRGERLGGRTTLPLAFTHAAAPVYCLGNEFDKPCGRAEKHARFFGGRVMESGSETYFVAEDGLAMLRGDVRIVDRIPRPDGVGAEDQWIHFDLSEQAMVAYEGDRPVYATLLSSGKRATATPTGLYTVNRVYATKVMNGVDEDGPYQVQEVPWAMYFKGNYAVHGAYWHSVFGNTRSHGCVNLPPVDARWLFYWSKPPLPQGWTANLSVQGPRVYITGETPPDVETPPKADESSDA